MARKTTCTASVMSADKISQWNGNMSAICLQKNLSRKVIATLQLFLSGKIFLQKFFNVFSDWGGSRCLETPQLLRTTQRKFFQSYFLIALSIYWSTYLCSLIYFFINFPPQDVKNMCDTGAAINKLMIVRSRKRIKSSGRLTGIFEPKINPPTSDK